jgi:hypothetical protein
MITKVDLDALGIVLSFCSAKSLCNLAQTCRTFCLATSEDVHSKSPSKNEQSYPEVFIFENVWRALCSRRWRIDDKICRRLGTNSMKSAYRLLSHRLFLPRGRYTEKHNYIFAKGAQNGICAWVLVKHTVNTRLRNFNAGSRVCRIIELRIGIQNACHGLVAIDISPQALSSSIILNSLSSEDTDESFCCPISASCLAFNGVPIPPKRTDSDGHGHGQTADESMVYLGPLDFALLSVEVMCPLSMHYETDFLCSMSNIDIKTRIMAPTYPFNQCLRESTVSPLFLEEDKIWDYFIELPGGTILLRDKPVNAW